MFADFLANLITVETQSFGELALGGIIVLDNRITPNAHPSNASQAGQLSRPVGTMMGPPAAPYSNRPLSRPPPGTPQSVAPLPSGPSGSLTSPMSIPPMDTNQRQVKCGMSPSQKPILAATPQNLAAMSPEQVMGSNFI